MFDVFTEPQSWLALGSLLALEIVLGIDNLLFIAIVAGRLPAEQQKLAYRLGLIGALVTRILLLLSLSWVSKMRTALFAVYGQTFSVRDLVLLGGGLFLLAKSAHEIYQKVEKAEEDTSIKGTSSSLPSAVAQIMLLDIIFSLDSVITAVGMVDSVVLMITAIVIAMIAMLLFAPVLGGFVNRHPSVKVLGLAFLTLIGVLLVAEGFHQHINRSAVYFSMAFSLAIELLHIRRNRKQPNLTKAGG